MNNSIRAAIIATSAGILSACAGSDSSHDLLPSTYDDSIACDTALHTGIRGSYNGQLQFESPLWVDEPESCTWDVSLSVATGYDVNGLCSIGFEFDSELISGTESCDELATSGYIFGAYGIDEQAPQWPIELTLTTTRHMSTGPIYPTGNDRDSGLWSYVFDGKGNASLPDVSETIGYSGVLVLFSDQPFQLDDYVGLNSGNNYE